MRKVRAGGAVDYYLGQVRSGMADYYLGGTGQLTEGQRERLHAPGSAWWGVGAADLGLSGAVGDEQFVGLFDKALHPDGSGRHVGRPFRQPDGAGTLAEAAAAAAHGDDDAYRLWMSRHELKRRGPQASVEPWRALDGRAVLAGKAGAGTVYNRTVEAELTRRLGVGWRDRPDGLREVDGIDDDLIALFSTRR